MHRRASHLYRRARGGTTPGLAAVHPHLAEPCAAPTSAPPSSSRQSPRRSWN